MSQTVEYRDREGKARRGWFDAVIDAADGYLFLRDSGGDKIIRKDDFIKTDGRIEVIRR